MIHRAELIQMTSLRQMTMEFLSRQLPVEEFEEWLVGHLQDFIDSQDSGIREFANKLDALLVEHGEGLLTEPELRKAIEELVNQNGGPEIAYITASSARLVSAEVTISPSVLTRVIHSFARV